MKRLTRRRSRFDDDDHGDHDHVDHDGEDGDDDGEEACQEKKQV